MSNLCDKLRALADAPDAKADLNLMVEFFGETAKRIGAIIELIYEGQKFYGFDDNSISFGIRMLSNEIMPLAHHFQAMNSGFSSAFQAWSEDEEKRVEQLSKEAS